MGWLIGLGWFLRLRLLPLTLLLLALLQLLLLLVVFLLQLLCLLLMALLQVLPALCICVALFQVLLFACLSLLHLLPLSVLLLTELVLFPLLLFHQGRVGRARIWRTALAVTHVCRRPVDRTIYFVAVVRMAIGSIVIAIVRGPVRIFIAERWRRLVT